MGIPLSTHLDDFRQYRDLVQWGGGLCKDRNLADGHAQVHTRYLVRRLQTLEIEDTIQHTIELSARPHPHMIFEHKSEERGNLHTQRERMRI